MPDVFLIALVVLGWLFCIIGGIIFFIEEGEVPSGLKIFVPIVAALTFWLYLFESTAVPKEIVSIHKVYTSQSDDSTRTQYIRLEDGTTEFVGSTIYPEGCMVVRRTKGMAWAYGVFDAKLSPKTTYSIYKVEK